MIEQIRHAWDRGDIQGRGRICIRRSGIAGWNCPYLVQVGESVGE